MTPQWTWGYIFEKPYEILALLAGLVVVIFAGWLAATLLFRMSSDKRKDRIDLSRIISEPTGEASLSRLQLLIFTFVIALSLFLIVVGHTPPAWPDKFPPEILTLLGISGSSYLVSKAIQAGATLPSLTISGPSGPVPPGGNVTFSVSAPNAPSGTALTQVTWSLDAPANGTIAPSPPDKAIYIAPLVSPGADTKVTIRAQATGFADGTATITLAGPPGPAPRPALAVSVTGPPSPPNPGVAVNLTVSMVNAPSGTALPPVTWSLEAPAHGTIQPIPPDKATYTAANPSPGAGTKVVIHASASGFDDGIVTLTLA
jgi:hypothetical protein